MLTLPGSLGIFAAEESVFTGGHAMTEENRRRTAAMLSEIWDMKPIKRIRVGDGVSILDGRRLSIHIMIQPDGAADFLGSAALLDQGLLSRFLVALPESLAGTRSYRDTPSDVDRAIRSFSAHLLLILETKPPLLGPDFIENELARPHAEVLAALQSLDLGLNGREILNAVAERLEFLAKNGAIS